MGGFFSPEVGSGRRQNGPVSTAGTGTVTVQHTGTLPVPVLRTGNCIMVSFVLIKHFGFRYFFNKHGY
jgi:hypothetical protein